MSYQDDLMINFREEYKKIRDRFKEEDFPQAVSAPTDDPWATGMPEEMIPTQQQPETDWNLDEMDDDLREFEHLQGSIPVSAEEYKQVISEHPAVQQYGQQMEDLLMSIQDQMLDPNDPMTPEEAQKVFAQMMVENFGDKF